MATIYWQSAEGLPNEGDGQVTDSHPLPTGIYWGLDENVAPEAVNMDRGLPVQVVGPSMADVSGRLYKVYAEITGIAAADALDANDQMGGLIQIAVPKNGCIVDARFIDIDFEGLAKECWLFDSVVAVAASDAAFSISDEDLRGAHVGVLSFSTFSTATASEVARSGDTPLWYTAPQGYLYMAVKTLGVDNIAAGKNPGVKLTIERYSDK